MMIRKILYAYPMRLLVLVAALLTLVLVLQAKQLWSFATKIVTTLFNQQNLC